MKQKFVTMIILLSFFIMLSLMIISILYNSRKEEKAQPEPSPDLSAKEQTEILEIAEDVFFAIYNQSQEIEDTARTSIIAGSIKPNLKINPNLEKKLFKLKNKGSLKTIVSLSLCDWGFESKKKKNKKCSIMVITQQTIGGNIVDVQDILEFVQKTENESSFWELYNINIEEIQE